MANVLKIVIQNFIDIGQRMLNGLAVADAGEYLTSRQKYAYMSKNAVAQASSVLAPEARRINARKQVALFMGNEMPANMMEYVVQTCERLNYGLTVLSFQLQSDAQAALSTHTAMLEAAGIVPQIVTLTGDPIPGITRYLRRHPEVAFLACKETGYLGRSFQKGTQSKNALPVPVVLLEAQQQGKQPVEHTEPEQITGKERVA